MKRFLLVVLALTLAACGTVRKIESGTNPIGERLTVDIDGYWNHIDFPGIKPAQLWTMEGAPVDELLIYADVKDGTEMHGDRGSDGKARIFTFKSAMPTEEVVAMFEGLLSRDQSQVSLKKIEPYPFAGRKGFRFKYERVRGVDGVTLRGVGFGAVDKGELFALLYHAPRLTFFARHATRVEAIARSARLR